MKIGNSLKRRNSVYIVGRKRRIKPRVSNIRNKLGLFAKFDDENGKVGSCESGPRLRK